MNIAARTWSIYLIVILLLLYRSSEGYTARSAAAAVQNLSCEAASRDCIRESAAVKKLVCLLGAEDMEVRWTFVKTS